MKKIICQEEMVASDLNDAKNTQTDRHTHTQTLQLID